MLHADTGSHIKARTPVKHCLDNLFPTPEHSHSPCRISTAPRPHKVRKRGTASNFTSLWDKIHCFPPNTSILKAPRHRCLFCHYPHARPKCPAQCPGRHEMGSSSSPSGPSPPGQGASQVFHLFTSATGAFYPLHRWPRPSFRLFKQ